MTTWADNREGLTLQAYTIRLNTSDGYIIGQRPHPFLYFLYFSTFIQLILQHSPLNHPIPWSVFSPSPLFSISVGPSSLAFANSINSPTPLLASRPLIRFKNEITPLLPFYCIILIDWCVFKSFQKKKRGIIFLLLNSGRFGVSGRLVADRAEDKSLV